MKSKFYTNKKRKNTFVNFIKIYYSITLLAFMALVIGVVLSAFFTKSKTSAFTDKISTQMYKSVLNQALPIIQISYNEKSSTSSDAQNIVKGFFYLFLLEPISTYVQTNFNQQYEKRTEISATTTNIPEDKNFLQDSSSIQMENADTDLEEHTNSEIVSNGKIIISNETSYKVNIQELQKEPLNFDFSKKNNKILIYHTHTTESYIPDISKLNSSMLTRSQDSNKNVVKVGKRLTDNLKNNYDIQAINNTTIHDYPNYNYSYGNALKTVTKTLKLDSKIKMVIDLHRDAHSNNNKLRKVAKINGKNAAKIMFVVSTGQLKKNHPNWKENLRLALELQENLLKICPQLTEKIIISKYTYNQHVSKGALLVEIGGDGNLIEECLESTQYLAKAINEVISE